MIKFTKKFAIIASLAVLTAGQFVAYGSSLFNNNNNESDSGQQVVVANAMAIPFSPNSPSSRCLEKGDLQILNSVTLCYRPKIQVGTMDALLATMYLDDANGDFTLPADVPPYLCVTRNIKTFVKPDGDNTRKTLVLLLTLSELKERAGQIIYDPSFLNNVAQADLSQNAVCALIRYGGDVIKEWGFRYTILAFQKMSGLSIHAICQRAKVCKGTYSTSCVVPVSCDPWVFGFSFIFKSN